MSGNSSAKGGSQYALCYWLLLVTIMVTNRQYIFQLQLPLVIFQLISVGYALSVDGKMYSKCDDINYTPQIFSRINPSVFSLDMLICYLTLYTSGVSDVILSIVTAIMLEVCYVSVV